MPSQATGRLVREQNLGMSESRFQWVIKQHGCDMSATAVHRLSALNHFGVAAEVTPERLSQEPLGWPLDFSRVIVEVRDQPVGAPEQGHVRSEPRLLEAEE